MTQLGTADYMAPEIIMPQARAHGSRSVWTRPGHPSCCSRSYSI